jgi:type 1 glutamine amidotransferase
MAMSGFDSQIIRRQKMMPRKYLTGLLLLGVLFGLSACTKKDEPVQEPARKILVVTGGHEYDEKEFFEMIDSFGISYDKAVMPQDMDLLAPGLEKKYAAIICYDQNHFHEKKEITSAQRENFGKLIQNGMPLLVLHHGVGSYPKWPPYREIAGGAYIFKGAVPFYKDVDGKEWGESTYEHDVDMDITVVDRDHPITQGVDDFTIRDEAYIGVYVSPKVHVLLTTDYPGATPEVAWVHRYGKSPVFTLTLGHGKDAYANENLRKLISNGIDWLIAGKVAIE